MDLSEWERELSGILPHMIDVRRELHRHPELSGHEVRTKERILRELERLGIPAKTFDGCNAVMGVLRNGDGPCVALRADMDALPIVEKTGLPFSSEEPGVMHACGHDIHMTLALISAAWFSANREKWSGTMKWLFEPEEETVGGGQAMTAQGCMEDPRVDCVIGQHVNPRYEAGTWYCRPGYVSGASDEITLTVRGRSGHGAYPESGVDAIVIAAQIVTALQTVVSRTLSPFDPAALTLGTIHGGTACNVICGEVQCTGTMRTLSAETRAKMQQRIRDIARTTAEGLGGSAEVVFTPGYGAVYNDDHYYPLVEQRAEALLGKERMVLREAPSLGVESFYYFIQDTPGVYYDIGSGIGTALHTPTFLIDESVIPVGAALQIEAALAVLNDRK